MGKKIDADAKSAPRLRTEVRAWLNYSRRLLCDDLHRRECAAAGGSPKHPGVDDPHLRWPGYLGPNYRPNGLIFVGNVHRDFASGGLGATQRDRLVRATRRWKRSLIDDADYLSVVQDVYEAGLNRWTVGNQIRSVLKEFGVPLDAIAYVNAARCQFPEVPPNLPNRKQELVRLCSRAYPISELVAFLKPAVVLFMSAHAYDTAIQSLGSSVTCVAFNQRNGTLDRPLLLKRTKWPVLTRLIDWTKALKKTIKTAKTPGNAKPESKEFRVGDAVSFLFGSERVRGTILRDLGPIGMKGRRLYLVEMPMTYTDPFRLELPAEDMMLDKSPPASEKRRRRVPAAEQ